MPVCQTVIRVWRAAFATAVIVAAARGPMLTAQSPAQRVSIDSIRTALTADSDRARVLGTLSRTRAETKTAQKDPIAQTELGWALLRAGEAADSDALVLASADAFYRAAEREPHWPYPWYGLGMAKAELAARRVPIRFPPHQPVGASWLEAAIRYFLLAARADSTYLPAAMALGQVVLDDHFGTETLEALRQLRPALDTTERDPAPFLLLGRLAFDADSYVTAHTGLQGYLARGGDTAVGFFEDARALYALHRRAAAESSYYAGATYASQAGDALYRNDIGWIADSAELQAYDTLTSPASRLTWLRRFWEGRDVEAGRRLGDRLEEHNRRWRHALDYFPFFGRFRARTYTRAFTSAQRDFDDRGVIYLRQGEPDERSNGPPGKFQGIGDVPNESWLYFRPGGNLIFHFAGADPGGWSLIGGLSELGSGEYDSRIDFGPVYARLAMLLPNDPLAPLLLREDSAVVRHSILVGTTTDAFPLRYPHPLRGIIQAYGAGGAEPGMARLLFVYALPDLRDLPYRRLADSSVVYALRLRVQAADSAGHLALNTDSVRLIHAHRPLAKGQTLTGFVELAVPPGEYRAKMMIADTADSIGDGWALSDLPAPALDGPALTLSDPILGRGGSGLSWVRPDGTIPLNPLNEYPKGSTAVLSYEVGGLAPGSTFTTRIAVRKFGADSSHNAISIAFPTTATSPVSSSPRAWGSAT